MLAGPVVVPTEFTSSDDAESKRPVSQESPAPPSSTLHDQARALAFKTIAYQKKQRVMNAVLLLFGPLTTVLVLGVTQFALDFFLSRAGSFDLQCMREQTAANLRAYPPSFSRGGEGQEVRFPIDACPRQLPLSGCPCRP